MQQAKRLHRRWPGQKEWEWCWDTTPWGGGHIVDRGSIGSAGLPDGGRMDLFSGLVTHPTGSTSNSGDQKKLYEEYEETLRSSRKANSC
jgi:hypothetical protein